MRANRMGGGRTPATPADPRWKRYGIHWHGFRREHAIADRGRADGFDDEYFRTAPPDETLLVPDDVVVWQRREIRRALGEARGGWSDPARQDLGDLGDSGEWAKALRRRLGNGMSSFQTVRVADTRMVELTAYALAYKDCDRHG